MKFDNSDLLNTYVSRLCERRCLLSFSCGKDSIGAWLRLRQDFDDILPYYLYPIPDLEFVEDSLTYYERYFGCHILRIPHPSLYRWLNNFVFQPPDRWPIIQDLNMPNFTYDDINAILKHDHQLPDPTYQASGVRMNDSLQRRTAMLTHGPLNERRQTFCPVFDWSADDLYHAIHRAGVNLPVDYLWFGRTFDGIDYRFLKPIKDHAPRDYQRILEWFPLADLEIFRYERR